MSHVEVTLKSGVTVRGDVTEFKVEVGRVTNAPTRLKWSTPDNWLSSLMYIDPNEVAAVVFIRSESERDDS